MNTVKYITVIMLTLVILSGCAPCGQQKEILARINNYEITKDKFETEFKESIYGRTDTLESRKAFLDNLIDRKLILQDAQEQGLDKEAGFLRLIQRFWEQSLLKIALDKKTQDKSHSINDWVTQLRKDARIEINEGLLKAK